VVIAIRIAKHDKPPQGDTQMTTTDETQQAVTQYLAQLDWMIADAKRELAAAAKAMARRAAEAVDNADAMLADQPCSLTWVEFAESDLRTAREAKDRLNRLIEQQKMLQFVAKQS
jgi:hypothetical protein